MFDLQSEDVVPVNLQTMHMVQDGTGSTFMIYTDYPVRRGIVEDAPMPEMTVVPMEMVDSSDPYPGSKWPSTPPDISS